MKKLMTLEADSLNYFAEVVEFENIKSENYLYFFSHLVNLEELELAPVSTPKSFVALSLFNTTLHTLIISDNQILNGRKALNDGSFILAIDKLVRAFKILTNLTSLDISGNEFSESTPKVLNALPVSLKSLCISKCKIGNYEKDTMLAASNLTNLTHLDISSNGLNDEALKAIQTYPNTLTKLKSLDIRGNSSTSSEDIHQETLIVFKSHNEAVNDPLFKSFCDFLSAHPEVTSYAQEDIVGDCHDHTINIYHD